MVEIFLVCILDTVVNQKILLLVSLGSLNENHDIAFFQFNLYAKNLLIFDGKFKMKKQKTWKFPLKIIKD
jgi:hypothetical protein